MKDFPWGIMLMSIAITFFWRAIYPTEIFKFVIACWISGAVLGIISGIMKVKEDSEK